MKNIISKKSIKILSLAVALIIVVVGIYFAYKFNYIPHRKFEDKDFGIEFLHSTSDADRDGVDDYQDILESAKKYVNTKPKYKSKYYESGYPDDEYGVCTDVVAFALLDAGYDLQALVDEDIKVNPQDYAIDEPDSNIDFRRVVNLKVYFDHTADSLTRDINKYQEWQAGDIVVWSGHIGIISDHRNKNGVPFVLHNANPIQASYEEDILGAYGKIVGHYRLKDTEREAIDTYFNTRETPKIPEALWTKNSGKEYNYEFTIEESKGTYTLHCPSDEYEDIYVSYTADGVDENRDVLLFVEDKKYIKDSVEKLPDTINRIEFSDINIDGYTDILITGYMDDEYEYWLFWGSESFSYDDEPIFTVFSDNDVDNNLLKEIFTPDLTIEDIQDYFVGKQKESSFKSYQEAYKIIISRNEVVSPGHLEYNLIYFDEDDIPELVVDQSGYGLNMYSFKDGKLICIMDWWPYGAGGNAGYEYAPKHNWVNNFDQDGGGEYRYYSIGRLVDDKVELLYCRETFAESDDVNYFDYSGNNLSESQIIDKFNETEDLEFEYLSGEYNATEILNQLGIESYDVTKFDSTIFDFSANGIDYHFVSGAIDDNQMFICLSDGTNMVKNEIHATSIKSYLFDRKNDRAFLYVFAQEKDISNLYIYNLNLNLKDVSAPHLYNGQYSLYAGEITDSDCFGMQTYVKDVFGCVAQKNFAISEGGEPYSTDRFSYFKELSFVNGTDEESKESSKYGDVIVCDKSFSTVGTKNYSKTYISVYKDHMDEEEEYIRFNKGTRFYLYKAEEDQHLFKKVFLISEDGYMIELSFLYRDNQFVRDDNLLSNYSDGEELYIKDLHLEN